jgi:GH15 family glucan-1,4-alpha-glucosidase
MPSGGIVAAATTSLPEQIGSVRNWDYRYCWVRDATFTLYSLMHAGFHEEAIAWREWLLRAAAGKPSDLQIMYGVAGERRLTEQILPWLPGYEGAAPVRIGNAASSQLQLDVYGELIDSMHQCRRFGMDPNDHAWRLQRGLLEFLGGIWQEPDEGIWEVRGPRRHFTHSKVMAWVALDRGIKSVENFGLAGPSEKWREVRRQIFEQVCREGFDREIGSFVQYYGSKQVDASLLMMPLVGFLPADDPRIRGTLAAIEARLLRDGFVQRYEFEEEVDGLPAGEGAFLACTFWLADNLVLAGRDAAARAISERLLAIRYDVGLLAEEDEARARRFVGNFPQAFSHVSLVNTAFNLSKAAEGGPAERRRRT